ncbi:putative DNA primase/helicase [Pseudovibrio ascidiaceicola]|uniref:DNA primase/helicase n=1 Tax=Pseudovibrio ascidiaceicola TaxID=285279 RepID=A0A1I4E3U3_9HYPH|nr:toprim domain-containing protein [Pseudovibrio ascidiaceicola]SFK99630.1 putative DNA primase/helicase [Pseudovibrio ascidiaceicola]
MNLLDQQWKDYKQRALDVSLLEAAKSSNATLRRSGKEHVGPCPACGGTDRFSVNPVKQKWNCRGAGGGGDAIGVVMHCMSVDFKAACEILTGEEPPSGEGTWDEEAKRKAAERKKASAAKAERESEEQAQQEADSTEYAQKLWDQAKPIEGTPAEAYLLGRRLPRMQWPDCLRFHPGLKYPDAGKLPALVCRVDDTMGDLTGIWRIFITKDGKKAPVANAKLGLGPVAGGAVRLQEATDGEVGIAEGVETALAVYALTGRPCWSCLSTAGLINFEPPLDIDRLRIYGDGDQAYQKPDGSWEMAPGEKAAKRAAQNLQETGLEVLDIALPEAGSDWLDVYNDLYGATV